MYFLLQKKLRVFMEDSLHCLNGCIIQQSHFWVEIAKGNKKNLEETSASPATSAVAKIWKQAREPVSGGMGKENVVSPYNQI